MEFSVHYIVSKCLFKKLNFVFKGNPMLNIESKAKRKAIHCEIYLKCISRRHQQLHNKNATICGNLGRLQFFITNCSLDILLHASGRAFVHIFIGYKKPNSVQNGHMNMHFCQQCMRVMITHALTCNTW